MTQVAVGTSVGSEVGVMEGVGVTVAVAGGGSGDAVSVAMGASKTIPLHPARSAVNKTMTVMR